MASAFGSLIEIIWLSDNIHEKSWNMGFRVKKGAFPKRVHFYQIREWEGKWIFQLMDEGKITLWNLVHPFMKSSEIKWNQVKSVKSSEICEIKWNQVKSVKSSEIKWNQVKSSEIKWNQVKSEISYAIFRVIFPSALMIFYKNKQKKGYFLKKKIREAEWFMACTLHSVLIMLGHYILSITSINV